MVKLLTSQKNTLFDIIEKAGHSPGQFEFEEIEHNDNYREIKLNYINSEYHFQINLSEGDFTGKFCPGHENYVEYYNSESWYNVYNNKFSPWVKYLKREIEAPDKWSRIQDEMKNISINIGSDDNNKFTAQEYDLLKQNILEIKNRISEINLLPEQLSALETKLDYLMEQAIKMNKVDWKNLFLGTIISIIIQLSISKEDGQALWNIIQEVFNTFVLP